MKTHNPGLATALLLACSLSAVDSAERFQLRARVQKIQGRTPAATQAFTVGYGGAQAKTTGNEWSVWMPCTEMMWNHLRGQYPNNGRVNPMVFWVGIKGMKDTTPSRTSSSISTISSNVWATDNSASCGHG